MKASINVIGAGAVVERLKAMTPAGRRTMNVEVGFSAPYAATVHENLAMVHPRGGQAKFLEQPARQYKPDMMAIVARNLRNKEGLELALKRAGEFLLDRAKELVPVRTGFLKNSGFVDVR